MKEINYNTDRLIILNYPSLGGGKFISLCLALSPKVLHQDKKLAEFKINGKFNEKHSLQIARFIFKKTVKSNNHFELGCMQLAGFNSTDEKQNQELLANELWRELTHQKEFYFCMGDHLADRWDHYPEAYYIIFKNCEWIVEKRNRSVSKKNYEQGKKLEKIIYFDQNSIKDAGLFKQEIKKLYDFFKLEEPNWNHIEELRCSWLDTFKIGF